MKVAIIGAGKVGRTLARALRNGPHRATLRALRRGPPRKLDAALVVLAVRDGALGPLAAELAESTVLSRKCAIVHVAGALGPEVLAPLRAHCAGVGQAHPMISFASSRVPPPLAGGHMLVTGDPVAVKRASTLARALGMVPREWRRIDRAGYHAAGGLVANGATALAAGGARLLLEAGVPARDVPRVLGPLLHSVAHNIEKLGLPGALTGPVRRGDARALERHLERIQASAPDLTALYLASAAAQLPLARALGDADPAALEEVERVLRRLARRT